MLALAAVFVPHKWASQTPPTKRNAQEETAMFQSVVRMGVLASAAVMGAASVSTAQAAWEPTRPVEIVVPAGPGLSLIHI